MLIAVAVAVPLAFGAPLPLVAALVVTMARPGWAAAGITLVAALQAARRPRPRTIDLEARFLLALAGELRTGATWRQALAAAHARVPGLGVERAVARARAGRHVDHVGGALRAGLPQLGRPAAAALALVATAGAPAAQVFGTLAGQAADRAAEQRDRSAATAQARLSAALVGGAPVALAVALLASGRAGAAIAAGPAGAALLGIGAGLLLAGGAVVVAMLRAAES